MRIPVFLMETNCLLCNTQADRAVLLALEAREDTAVGIVYTLGTVREREEEFLARCSLEMEVVQNGLLEVAAGDTERGGFTVLVVEAIDIET